MSPAVESAVLARVGEAVEASRRAQAEWWSTPQPRRWEVLRTLARDLGERREDFVDAVRAETGKPRIEALAEVLVTVDLVRHYLDTAWGTLAPRGVGAGWLPGRVGWHVREPWGVIGAITPWNYPLVLPADSVVTALFAGNGIVVKPSEFTPSACRLLAEVVGRCGVPAGLVQVVEGDGAVGEALVRSGVDKVVFTGSTATGRLVMAAAATAPRGPVPVTLELGGKDPALVLEDADLERAAPGVVYGAFFNAGQTCISTERAYVVDAVYEDFVRRVTEVARSLGAGPGPGADVGPVSTDRQLAIVREHLADARERGARALVGGLPEASDPSRPAGHDRVVPPTVLVDVTPDMKVVAEETFGPVLPVVRVADTEAAVAAANDTGYGLFASVWTGDLARGERIARRLRAGGVSINDTLTHYALPGLSMGGVGDSGFGRRRGAAGLEDLTRQRTMVVRRFGPRTEPWWYPYTPRRTALVEALVVLRSRGVVRGLREAVRVLRGAS